MSRNRSKFVGQSQVGNSSNGENETHHHHHHSPGLSSAHHGNNSVFDGGTTATGHTPSGQANSSSKRNNNVNNFHSPGGSKNMGKGGGKKSIKNRPDVSTPFKHGSSKSPRGHIMTTIPNYGNDSVTEQINSKVRYQESQGFSPSLSRSAEQILEINTDIPSDSSIGKVASESDLNPDEESNHTQPTLSLDTDTDSDSPIISKPKKKRRPSLK